MTQARSLHDLDTASHADNGAADIVWDGARGELCGYIADALQGLAALSGSADLPDLAAYLRIGSQAARNEQKSLAAQAEVGAALRD